MYLRAMLMATCIVTSSVAQEFKTVDTHIASQSLVEDYGAQIGIAPTQDPPPLSPIALSLIKEFEGWEPEAYNDPAGYCTIGYGHLIALKKCEDVQLGDFVRPISEAKGEELLIADTKSARGAVRRLVTASINDAEYGALSSFVFNIGKGNFAKSTLLELLNQGEAELAARQFKRWVKARGEVYPGLVARRLCEEALFRGALDDSGDGTFSRSQCNAVGIASAEADFIDIQEGEEP